MNVSWIERLTHSRILYFLIVSSVTVCGVAVRLIGLGNGLWLDEAWVANSVRADSVASMFHYDAWLQTTPPLMLLLVRVTVRSLGMSNYTFRLVPLLFGLMAVVCMFFLVRRVLSPLYALPAWILLVFSPVAIFYSKSLKQYSAELAAVTVILLVCILYLERPTLRRFCLLVAVVAVSLPMAYPVALFLPGISMVVWLAANQTGNSATAPARRRWEGLIRALILDAVAGGILIGLYLFFLRPNTSPSLHAYFNEGREGFGFFRAAMNNDYTLLWLLPLPAPVSLRGRLLVFGAVGLLIFVGLILAWVQYRNGTRKWLQVQVICGLPVLLLFVCNGFMLYPVTNRTVLFLLPAVILLLLCSLQLIFDVVLQRSRREWLKPTRDLVMVCATLVLIVNGAWTQPWGTFHVPEEDVEGAVSFLHANVQSGDVLWVHSTCAEAFKLYAAMTGWSNAPAQFGHTGYPCCPRGVQVGGGVSNEKDVRSDLDRVPASFSGKVWLLYNTRADHWAWVGADEPKIMEDVFRERGCLQKQTPTFHHIGVSYFDCTAAHAQLLKGDGVR